MAGSDALSSFDWSTVSESGIFVKFKPGEPMVLRVLTTDPVVTNESYDDKRTGETIVTTKFSFVVYNWTEKKAQIWKATGKTAKTIGELHVDPDFGANIKNVDLKVTPPEKGEIKAYEIQVLPTPKQLTMAQIDEARAINLDEKVKDGQRMSFYDPKKAKGAALDETVPDEVIEDIEDIGGEPISLSDIPF